MICVRQAGVAYWHLKTGTCPSSVRGLFDFSALVSRLSLSVVFDVRALSNAFQGIVKACDVHLPFPWERESQRLNWNTFLGWLFTNSQPHIGNSPKDDPATSLGRVLPLPG